MCKNCTEEAFLKYCNDWKNVCLNCYEEYEKEKDRQSGKFLVAMEESKSSSWQSLKYCYIFYQLL